MKSTKSLLILIFSACFLAACKNTNTPDEQPIVPEPLAFAINDFGFVDAGMAWADDFDPTDLESDNHTHVSYTGTFSTKPLIVRDLGDKTFFGLNLSDTGERIWFGYNLVSPMVVFRGKMEENLLGGAQSRVFHFDDFQSFTVTHDYHFGQASMAIENLDTGERASYLVRGGQITVSGTAPDYTFDFDVIISGGPDNKEGTLTGRISPDFRFFDRR